MKNSKKKNAVNAQALLEKYKNYMMDEGIDEKNIELKTAPRKLGLAKDIIEFSPRKNITTPLPWGGAA